MIPESFIQELLSRIDIVEVINKVVPLKRTGKADMGRVSAIVKAQLTA